MNPATNTTSTRVSPHMARLWQMINILFTIRSFEMKIAGNEEKIRKCNEGTGRLLPTYTQSIRDSYQGAIDTWKIRIREEEGNYNLLLNQMVAHALYTDVTANPPVPELPEHRTIEHDDDIESLHHQRTCGGHSPY